MPFSWYSLKLPPLLRPILAKALAGDPKQALAALKPMLDERVRREQAPVYHVQGIALYLDGDTAGAVEDPSQSKVSGKMGYASIPVDPTVNKVVAHFGGWQYAINKDSKIPSSNSNVKHAAANAAAPNNLSIKLPSVEE